MIENIFVHYLLGLNFLIIKTMLYNSDYLNLCSSLDELFYVGIKHWWLVFPRTNVFDLEFLNKKWNKMISISTFVFKLFFFEFWCFENVSTKFPIDFHGVTQLAPKNNKEHISNNGFCPYWPYLGLNSTLKTLQHICVKVILVLPLEMPIYIIA